MGAREGHRMLLTARHGEDETDLLERFYDAGLGW